MLNMSALFVLVCIMLCGVQSRIDEIVISSKGPLGLKLGESIIQNTIVVQSNDYDYR